MSNYQQYRCPDCGAGGADIIDRLKELEDRQKQHWETCYA